MCEIVNSPLWKSLRVGLNKAERAKLLKELRKVHGHENTIILNSTSLHASFVWDFAPQGWAFWHYEDVAHFARLEARK